MISALKAAYKSQYLKKLLKNFDAPKRALQQRGQKGLDFGGKPDILDAMELSKLMWKIDEML